ncbi:hypothetical protein BDV95DRAFT_605172 [Massariosphaeria phaeospora]|uniref:BZIP domain-containing protein n=1 Tax=Massariosphaeria phaeospora TaxID=100035 RepID=A0A7C8ICG7_9PLEO|nr:hypothetical protein BDV95DRAFT_605172 [Massariosphaeria phaeospora]
MASLRETIHAQEDWRGKTSTDERRKLQNRLHQRAWRRRKADAQAHAQAQAQAQAQAEASADCSQEHASINEAFARATAALVPDQTSQPAMPLEHREVAATPPTLRVKAREAQSNCSVPFNVHDLMAINLECAAPSTQARDQFRPQSHHTSNLISHPTSTMTKTSPPLPRSLPPILQYIFPPPASNSAPFTFIFPLSPDHFLITLVQYNVLRAVLTNLAACSLLQSLPHTCEAILLPPLLPPPSTPPPTFTPTTLQKTVAHPQWLDSVPCPLFRDNLIRANAGEIGEFDSEVLCNDICGGLYDGFDDTAQKGLLVWGEPWLVASWEISEGFAEKWGWLLWGCREMVEITNGWRAERGEDRLVIEIE